MKDFIKHSSSRIVMLCYRGLVGGLWLLNATAAEPPPVTPGAPVDYARQAFQPKEWHKRNLSLELVPWQGRRVVFLTTDGRLDPGLLGVWVGRLDAGWELYGDLTGRKPGLFKHMEGKPTIAAVPSAELTCGAGCGYVGATGIELAMFYEQNYPMLKKRPGAMPHYVFYEMGRNYYTFGDRHSCFITGFAVFMRYVCMDTLGCEDYDLGTRRVIESVEPRLAASGLSFLDLFTMSTGRGEKVSLIKDAGGKMIHPSDQPVRYASAMMRLWREQGGNEWLKRFYRELATVPEHKPTREGALQQGWYWMLCAGVAAGKDLSPVFAGEWKLPLRNETRAALAAVNWTKPGLSVKEVDAAVKPMWGKEELVP